MKLSTHRHIQLSSLMDKASTERVRYYCNAQKASWLGNHGAAIEWTRTAWRWEQIRQHCCKRMFQP